ncbi:MAG TPA: CRTAC1 family protein [Thermoanaerobaculia bacterium]|nr:CRTAC1 family protein [Thermoanaerobaculia bacterium]
MSHSGENVPPADAHDRRPDVDATEDPALEEYLEDIEDLQDDEVIGRALRVSALVLAGVALVALLVYVGLRYAGREQPVTQAIEVEAPQRVAEAGAPPPLRFTDVTESAGISFRHTNGASGLRFLPETMGSGAAFFDYDGDGDQDLLLLDGDQWDEGPGNATLGVGRSVLYQNDGTGSFRDVTDEVGLDLRLYATGVAVGDFDNDGHPDLFVAAVGRNRLLRNLGGRRFEDVTDAAGVGGDAAEWSTAPAFFDADNDGDLDLFVGNYVRWSKAIDLEVDYRLEGVGRAYGPPVNYQGTFPYLYRNDGGGRFTDVSEEAGMQVRNPALGGPVAKTLGVAPIDADRDGWMDLVVANDTVRNFFFHNQGDGTFSEEGELYGVAYGRDGNATGAMGIDAGYFRDDGELAIAIGNFANEMSSLYVTQGDPALYADEAIAAGLGAPSRRVLSFGVFFFDVDLDGRLDLLQVNGHLEENIAAVDPSQQYLQPPQLFWNAGDEASRALVPVDAAALGDFGQKLVARASSFADIDGDGDLDVLITQTGDRPVLLRNDQELGHHWLRFRLRGDGVTVNRDAIGAWVELVAGGRTQRRQVMPTRSYQAQVESVVTFGLGQATAVESVEVLWPDGSRQTVTVDGLDRLYEVAKVGVR